MTLSVPKKKKEPPSGVHLWLLLWKSFKAVETLDKESIRSLGFQCLSDFGLLEVLYHKGSLPINAIGKKIFLTSGSLTTAVDRAEKSGLVTREHGRKDRRVVLVHLTDKGKALIEEAFQQHAAHLESIFNPLGAKERKNLAKLLKKIGKYAESSPFNLNQDEKNPVAFPAKTPTMDPLLSSEIEQQPTTL